MPHAPRAPRAFTAAARARAAAPRRARAAAGLRHRDARGAAVAAVAVPPEGPAVRASPPRAAPAPAAIHANRRERGRATAGPRGGRARRGRNRVRGRFHARGGRGRRGAGARRRRAKTMGGGTATPDRRGHRSGQGPRRDAAPDPVPRAARAAALRRDLCGNQNFTARRRRVDGVVMPVPHTGRDAGRRGAHRGLAAAAGLGAVVRGRGAAARGGEATARAAGDLEGRRPVAGAAGAAVQEAAPRGAARDDPGQGLRAAAGDAPGPLVGPGRRARARCGR